MKKFSLFGYQITIWWWNKEKRLGTKAQQGIGLIIERLPHVDSKS